MFLAIITLFIDFNSAACTKNGIKKDAEENNDTEVELLL